MFNYKLHLSLWMVVLCGLPLRAQELPAVKIEFAPPPLEEAVYSIGVYEAKSQKLIRQLCMSAPESAFRAALNGLVTTWDRKNDHGDVVSPGRYAVRGYALGNVTVEGMESLGNDWLDPNEEDVRIQQIHAILLSPISENYLQLIATTTDGIEQWIQVQISDGAITFHAPLENFAPLWWGDSKICVGQEDSIWIAAGKMGLFQMPENSLESIMTLLSDHSEAALGQMLESDNVRSLSINEDELIPIGVSASLSENKLYLLEEDLNMQRVRALTWTDEDGEVADSHWETVWEKTIETAPQIPIPQQDFVPIYLRKNPLYSEDQKQSHRHLKLNAAFDAEGSYLQIADGLRLCKISDRKHLCEVRLALHAQQQTNPTMGNIVFYQTDRAAWEKFLISNISQCMAFDAGEVELTELGEK